MAVADVHAQLGCEAIPAAGAGDCFPLSAMCGFELTADKVAAPNGDATETVRLARVGSVDAVAGEGELGGVAAATVRGEEGLPRAADEAEAKLGPWRSSFHWVTAEARLSAAFMFGVGVAPEALRGGLGADRRGEVPRPGARVRAVRRGGRPQADARRPRQGGNGPVLLHGERLLKSTVVNRKRVPFSAVKPLRRK